MILKRIASLIVSLGFVVVLAGSPAIAAPGAFSGKVAETPAAGSRSRNRPSNPPMTTTPKRGSASPTWW
jgi:hypothetical protein